MKTGFDYALVLCIGSLLFVGCGSKTNDDQGRALSVLGANITVVGNTMFLNDDITTDETIWIADGMTLNGNHHEITAVDPDSGHFVGAVVQNAGSTAHVEKLTVSVANLANVNDGGADRLRGIMFEGASGSITHCKVLGINQGASGSQEGNAIEIRNAPFDGTHPNTVSVEIAHNLVDAYQKTGIVANGDVSVLIHHNHVGASATQSHLAANGIQLGFGAIGSITHNKVAGNQWLGASNFAATAILVVLADDAIVSKNNIVGNSDVGIFFSDANGGTIDNNRVFDSGLDGPNGDYGLVNFGDANAFTNNKVRGFDFNHYGVTGGKNKAIPGGPKAF